MIEPKSITEEEFNELAKSTQGDTGYQVQSNGKGDFRIINKMQKRVVATMGFNEHDEYEAFLYI